MSASVLTADLGNSALKLVLWEDGEAPRAMREATLDWEELGAAPSASWLREFGGATEVLVSAVAGEERAGRFAAACQAEELPEPRAPGHGLRVLCRDEHTIGRDRLFAARGAWELLGEAALVVDVGTALTVDALGAERSFLGGAIAPGPRLLADALARGTADLFEVRARRGAAALGRDSREALISGVSHGLRGAVRELVLGVGREAGLESAPLVLTGGARELVADLWGARRVVSDVHLVARGLLAAGREP